MLECKHHMRRRFIMDNQLSTSANHDKTMHNVPINNETHHDLRGMIHHFWNMLDFPQHTADTITEPKIEVSENKNEVLVSAEVPGIEPENLDVEISSDGYLSVSGEKKQQTEQKHHGSCFSEITYGSFKRTIPLPWDLEFDKANAEYDNGILKIAIPKSASEQTKKKRLNINKKRKN